MRTSTESPPPIAGRPSGLRPLAFAAMACLLLVTTACTRVVPREELDGLNRSLDVKTVIFEDDYSIYSPYTSGRTRYYQRVIEEEFRALDLLIDAEVEEPILIQLRPVEQTTTYSGPGNARLHPPRTVIGYATLREVVIYVMPEHAPTGEPRRALPDASEYRSIIRHELAHIFVHRLKLPADSWIQEGIAEAVETFDLIDGKLDPNTPFRISPRRLARWGPFSLESVLSWQENGFRVEKGMEEPNVRARKLAMTFVLYLMEQHADLPFTERLEKIGTLPREELLTMEDAWQQWLADCCDAPRKRRTRPAIDFQSLPKESKPGVSRLRTSQR